MISSRSVKSPSSAAPWGRWLAGAILRAAMISSLCCNSLSWSVASRICRLTRAKGSPPAQAASLVRCSSLARSRMKSRKLQSAMPRRPVSQPFSSLQVVWILTPVAARQPWAVEICSQRLPAWLFNLSAASEARLLAAAMRSVAAAISCLAFSGVAPVIARRRLSVSRRIVRRLSEIWLRRRLNCCSAAEGALQMPSMCWAIKFRSRRRVRASGVCLHGSVGGGGGSLGLGCGSLSFFWGLGFGFL